MPSVALDTQVLSAFRQFYAVLVELREKVAADPWSASAEALPEEVAEARQAHVSALQSRLMSKLQRLEVEARAGGGERAGRRIATAGYVMAALADEVFLAMEWEGKDVWGQSLLEDRLYGTQLAGEEVFQRTEAVLKEREDREMATVYLLALALGFEGQYRGRGPDGREAIADLKSRLLSFVGRGETELREGLPLFPEVYTHTLEGSGKTRLPRVRTWSLILTGVILVLLVISHLAWLDASSSMREVLGDLDWLNAGGGGGS